MAIKTKTVDFGGLTLKVNEILYGVADRNDAGTLLDASDLASVASVTAGTAEADKAIVLDSNADVTSGINDFTIDGDLTVTGGLFQSVVAIPDGTTYAVLTANSGKIHIVPALTANCTITLPAAAAGLYYEFWGGHNAADAEEWIFVPTAGFFIGGLLHADVGGATAALYSNGSSNDVFTVVNPAAGTNVKFISNGTNWYVNGTLSSADIGTMADA
jgi:hypothetical protein